MNWLDIAILGVAGFTAMVGLGMGGIHVGITGAGALAGTALAGHFHGRVEPVFSRFTESQNGAEIGAFAAILVAVLIASVALGMAIRTLLGGLMLGWVDRVLGLALAVVVTFVVGSALFSAVQSYPVAGLEQAIDDSTLGSFLADNFDTVLRGIRFIPRDLGV